MKSVGKQLEEARLARNWTPELAARETKIKVDRLRDLEVDDYTHFSSPTYARGFVRTYARALGLDEYKILRQLDHKLPEDETSSFTPESGVPYIPETSRAAHASSGSNAGLYIAMSLGFGVVLVMSVVLFEAYRAGVLPRYFAESAPEAVAPATNDVPLTASGDAPPRAMPVDPNVPVPPIPATDTGGSLKALPVDPNTVARVAPATNLAPSSDDAPLKAQKALAVDPSELTNAPTQVASITPPVSTPLPADTSTTNAPHALPVDPAALAAASPPLAPGETSTNTVVPAPLPGVALSLSARQSNAGPVHLPPEVSAPVPPEPTPVASAPATTTTNDSVLAATTATPDKKLILTASRDSFIRVTSEDAPESERVLYASVLHTGQSVGFDGRKFSINVGIPAAIDVTLDGVNYGPHSDQEAPETFTVESHQQ